jgi:hypothetical protein
VFHLAPRSSVLGFTSLLCPGGKIILDREQEDSELADAFRIYIRGNNLNHSVSYITMVYIIHECLFFIIKPTRFTNFTNLFWHETLKISDYSSVHHQEFIHSILSNGVRHRGL